MLRLFFSTDMKILGWIIVGLVGLLMMVNGIFMLLSPQRWFQLPPWLGSKGTVTEQKYSDGWGAVQIRFVGAVLIGAVVWVIYDMFFSQR
jgi:hypothetical protein